VKKLLALLASLMLLATVAGSAMAKQPNKSSLERPRGDNLPGKLANRQNALRQAAIQKVIDGSAKAHGANQVVKVRGASTAGDADDIFVELAFEGEDQILTLLGEFGEDPATHNHGTLGDINHGGDPGPLHNEIPQPDRLGVDNTTIWEPDFNPAYYERILFDKDAEPSMANWYLAQSSGRYSVDGYVSDWVQVPNNEAAYGSNYCGGIICTRDIGRFIEDQADTWWDELVDEVGSEEAANDFLAQFDVWDRYDWDLDGDFNEPDGYIDHFQSVHAGEGEETGGGAQGEDAIWSHRSYVNSVPIGSDGPADFAPFGGAQIGDSNYWIGDYTVEPENGGVGVFAHEFGHDLGLPDEYDTSGNTGGAENGTGWWTPWSQGSYGTVSQDLGSYPVDSSAWEKLQLGWLNYDVAYYNRDNQRYTLGPSERNSTAAQALVVILPDRKVSTDIGDPFAGNWFYNSDNGNDLNNTMTKQVTLPAGTVNLSFKAKYHMEPCYDFAFVEVSTNGTDFTSIDTSLSTDEDLSGNNPDGTGISGISGTTLACDDDLSPTPEWVDVTADLSAYDGMSVWLRFRYKTDPAVVGDGVSIDNIAITGNTTDGAETVTGWDFDGWFRTNGSITTSHNRYYIAEYRTYIGYDRALRKGPYNFTDPADPDAKWVQHFPYQDGLLIWLWDTAEDDNNVGDHPGRGLILPIDAHFKTFNWKSGDVARPRLQSYDATFTLDPTKELSLYNMTDKLLVPSHAARPVFDDEIRYWQKTDSGDAPGDGRYQAAWNSVKNPHTGTKIRILDIYHNGMLMDIRVN